VTAHVGVALGDAVAVGDEVKIGVAVGVWVFAAVGISVGGRIPANATGVDGRGLNGLNATCGSSKTMR